MNYPTILIIEDSPVCKVWIKAKIKNKIGEEVEILEAGSLHEAALIIAIKNIDLIILDLGLPDSNGTDTIIKIKEIDKNVPIVVFSSFKDNKMVDCHTLGISTFLEKGDNNVNWWSTILNALGS